MNPVGPLFTEHLLCARGWTKFLTRMVSLKSPLSRREGVPLFMLELQVWLQAMAWLLWAGFQRLSIPQGVAFGGTPGLLLSGSHSAQNSSEARTQMSLPQFRLLLLQAASTKDK